MQLTAGTTAPCGASVLTASKTILHIHLCDLHDLSLFGALWCASCACEAHHQDAEFTQLCLSPTCCCRSRWFVASSIIGATSMPQLKENLEAFSISLSQEAIDDVNAVYKRFRDPPIAA